MGHIEMARDDFKLFISEIPQLKVREEFLSKKGGEETGYLLWEEESQVYWAQVYAMFCNGNADLIYCGPAVEGDLFGALKGSTSYWYSYNPDNSVGKDLQSILLSGEELLVLKDHNLICLFEREDDLRDPWSRPIVAGAPYELFSDGSFYEMEQSLNRAKARLAGSHSMFGIDPDNLEYPPTRFNFNRAVAFIEQLRSARGA